MKVENRAIKQKGYDLAQGMIAAFYTEILDLLKFALKWIAITMVIILLMNAFDIGTDDSDDGGWNRSGMSIHTDHKTGIQYLSTKNGGMIRRAEE